MSVKLAPADKPEETVEVALSVANMSKTVRDMLEDFGGSTETPIPLHNVSAAVLARVVAYCAHHDAHPEAALGPDAKKGDVSAWDREFLQVDQATLFELILAANYLDIPPLLDAACATVANMIKGKTPEQIRQAFNIKNDFSPEEEEKVRKENEWAEER